MPDEFALDFGDLDLLAVQLADQLGRPLLGEQGKFLRQVDFYYQDS